MREIIYGKKGAVTYWEITTAPETMPSNSTSFVKTNLKGKLKKIVGNLYGLRTWVEYGFRQCKQELGGTDYRFTSFKDLEKWWSIIFCVYTMISLNFPAFFSLNLCAQTQYNPNDNSANFSAHQEGNHQSGWKNTLNNFRLVIQPILLFWLIYPGRVIFHNYNLYRFRLDGNDKVKVNNSTFPHGPRTTNHHKECNRN
jgi:hypothetical protein